MSHMNSDLMSSASLELTFNYTVVTSCINTSYYCLGFLTILSYTLFRFGMTVFTNRSVNHNSLALSDIAIHKGQIGSSDMFIC